MESLPGWGGCWEHMERLESDGSDIAGDWRCLSKTLVLDARPA